MGALSPGAPFDNLDADDSRRYHTSIKVLIHSHTTDDQYFDLSDDVASAQVTKTIKGMGAANLTLTPTKNFMNLIRPGDVINIYFDTKDGEGWVRTFFGYVDRLEEEYTVSPDGTPSSSYHLIASDWQKAIEATEVYFNPHLSGRTDVGGSDFATFNIGGLSMITRGLQVDGAPSDCVTSVLLLQLGFGSQWILPDSHPVFLADEGRLTSTRNSVARSGLLKDIQTAIGREELSGVEALLDQVTPSSSQLSPEETTESAEAAAAFVDQINTNLANIDADERERIVSRVTSSLVTYASATAPSSQRSLLEVINLTDFIEREAMDGYAFELGIWQQQGPLMSIVRSVSNDCINELMFDLRPISAGEGPRIGTEWDRSGDDIQGNLKSDYSSRDGVRYMPAVVMREFPWSTVDVIDAENVAAEGNDLGESLGQVPIGAIFSNQPNVPGRHIVQIPNLNYVDGLTSAGPRFGYKIMDVAVLSEKEVVATRLGRSDEDIFNLFAMTSDFAMGSEAKWFMRDFVPIITPIHIMRHGLRVREVRTRFTKFPHGRAPANPTPATAAAPTETAGARAITIVGASWVEPGSPLVRAFTETLTEVEDVKTAGVRGAVIRGWLEAAEAETLTGRVVVVVEMGGNGAPTSAQVLAANATLVEKGASTVLWATPPVWPIEGETKDRRAATAAAITEAGVTQIAGAVLTPADVGGTDIHPRRSAYERFGVALAESTRATGAIAPGGILSLAVGSPVGRGAAGYDNFITSAYKYRKASWSAPRPQTDPPTTRPPLSQFWHFHNGVDIGPRTGDGDGRVGSESVTGEDIPIYAIADGYVICAARSGIFSRYGNCVGIHHPQLEEEGSGKKVISFYAHLSSIESRFAPANTIVNDQSNYVANGFSGNANASYSPTYVTKGERIGYMGKTFGTIAHPGEVFNHRIPHLHFEITSRIPSKDVNDVWWNEAARAAARADNRGNIADFLSPEAAGEPPDPGSRYSQDPEAWFALKSGTTLQALLAATPSDDSVDFEEGGGEEGIPPEEAVRTAESEGVEPDEVDALGTPNPPAQRTVTVDDQRRQLGRWSLLQDHWFQHNLEYLNGTVACRPAPEIRVGYRLDLLERNLSFYVENVNHSWQYPDVMTTQLTVTRGQPNNPYPAYALPPTPGFPGAATARRRGSRLAKYFTVPDPVAVRNHVSHRDPRNPQRLGRRSDLTGRSETNDWDNPVFWGTAPYDYSELDADYEAGKPAPGLVPALSISPDAEDDQLVDDAVGTIDAVLDIQTGGVGVTGAEADVLGEDDPLFVLDQLDDLDSLF